MKPIRRWDREDHPLGRLKSEMDGVFQRFFEEPFFAGPLWSRSRNFTPALNIEEKSNEYVIEAEIPGMRSEEVEIELNGNVLTIKGEKKEETKTESEERNMHLVERSYGQFQRSLTLPDNVDVDNITAENENGILYIHVPKSEDTKPRRIDIHDRNNKH